MISKRVPTGLSRKMRRTRELQTVETDAERVRRGLRKANAVLLRGSVPRKDGDRRASARFRVSSVGLPRDRDHKAGARFRASAVLLRDRLRTGSVLQEDTVVHRTEMCRRRMAWP